MPDVDEVAPNIYRIATFVPRANFTMCQFLLRAARPLLFHTGPRALFTETLEGVARVLDPASLRWIAWSHLEADECGSANELVRVAPNARLATGRIGTRLAVGDFFDHPVRGMADGEVLDLGGPRLRFLLTPHVPHSSDATVVFEETTKTLLASDLFSQFGNPSPATDQDVVDSALRTVRDVPDLLPVGPETIRVLHRLEALTPAALCAMHGPTYTGDCARALAELRRGLTTLADNRVRRATQAR